MKIYIIAKFNKKDINLVLYSNKLQLHHIIHTVMQFINPVDSYKINNQQIPTQFEFYFVTEIYEVTVE
jgi:4-diphosphocytidyl-2C-methyl-D-erythritol kinase